MKCVESEPAAAVKRPPLLGFTNDQAGPASVAILLSLLPNTTLLL